MRLITNDELGMVSGGDYGDVDASGQPWDSLGGPVNRPSSLNGGGSFQVVEVTGHKLDFIDRLYATASVIAGDCIAGGTVGGTIGAIGGQFVLPVLGAGPGAIGGGLVGCTLGVGAGLIADIFDLRQTSKP